MPDPVAGLYVHVPFCTSVCPYCDFAVLIAGADRRRSYLRGIADEAASVGWDGPPFDTVYLGGGTPSALEPGEIAGLVESLRRLLPVLDDAWVTLEANPEHVTAEAAARWRRFGVRTLSLGVQSFDDRDLAFLGRRHDGAAARRALAVAVSSGFDIVSVDLIFGLPGHDPQGWQRQLDLTLAGGATHLSCYQLTVHEGTVLGRRAAAGLYHDAPEGLQADLFRLTFEHLGRAGWQGYEVSNFAASPGHRSRHNQKYWRHEPYLGLGPSAHSFNDHRRWWNHRKLRRWQQEVDHRRSPVETLEEFDDGELLTEAVMLAVRTSDGLDLDALTRRFGRDLAEERADAIAKMAESGLLRLEGRRLRPTVEGLAVADAVARELLP